MEPPPQDTSPRRSPGPTPGRETLWGRLWTAPGPNARFLIATGGFWSIIQAATDPYKALFFNRLGLSAAAIGVLVSCDLVLRASGLLLSGWTQRRFGAKRMLIAADSISWVLPYLVLSVATRPWHAVVAVLLTSLNGFAFTPYTCLMAQDIPAKRRTRAYTLMHLCNIAPSLAVPWCAGLLVGHHAFLPLLRGLFLSQAVAMAVGIGWRARRLQDLRPSAKRPPRFGRVLRRIGSDPAFVFAWIALATQGIFQQIWNNFSAIFLVRHLGLSDQFPAWIAEAGALGFAFGSLALQARLKERHALRSAPWALGLQAVLMLAYLAHPSGGLVLAISLGCGLCSSLYTAATSSILTSALPEEIRDHGFALGYVGAHLVGAALMPWAGRALQTDLGIFPWLSAGALCLWAFGAALAHRSFEEPIARA